MKKLILLIAAGVLSLNCFATGPLPINTTQQGFLSFTNAGSCTNTVTFNPAFTYPPIVSTFLFSGVTNSLPFTNSVTTTNFTLITSGSSFGATNGTIAWVAYPVQPHIQYGTITTGPLAGGAIYYTNTYTEPFATAPTVIASSSVSNIVVTASGATTNVLSWGSSSVTNGVIYWEAIGSSTAPATTPVTY